MNNTVYASVEEARRSNPTAAIIRPISHSRFIVFQKGCDAFNHPTTPAAYKG